MHRIRTLVAAAAASLPLTVSAPLPAAADTRIFIIENSDGYGVDHCLAAGAPCGARFAAAWCRAHDYDRAIDFGQVTQSALTPASAAGEACTGPLCPEAVAITCSR